MINAHKIVTYTIDDHPDNEAVYDWIRNNWHDLGEFAIQDAVESLKEFSSYYDTRLDYAISLVPDRGEYIHTEIDDTDVAELSGVRLWKYLNNNYPVDLSGNCPFTGVTYDETLLDEIRAFIAKPDSRTFQELLNDCTHNLLSAIHDEGDYIYSDEGLNDLLQANEYEFTEAGKFYC